MVRKGVILCGGQGTRFLPATKALPKEMLPVVDTPVLQYIVDEMIDSGITDICIVISPGKEEIIRYFSPKGKLEKTLRKKGDEKGIAALRRINKGAKFLFAVQKLPKGMADALLKAREFIGDDPFVLSTGDDLVKADVPVSKQLIDAFDLGCDAVIGGQMVPEDKIHMYGSALLGDNLFGNERAFECKKLVEKPKSKEEAPSLFAALGRYVLSPVIFDKIAQIKPDKKGELQVTDALGLMCEDGKVCAYNFEGYRYDMGSKAGSVQATISFALNHPDTKEETIEFLKNLKI